MAPAHARQRRGGRAVDGNGSPPITRRRPEIDLASRKESRHESEFSARERLALDHTGGHEIPRSAPGDRAAGYHPGITSSLGQGSRYRTLAGRTALATR